MAGHGSSVLTVVVIVTGSAVSTSCSQQCHQCISTALVRAHLALVLVPIVALVVHYLGFWCFLAFSVVLGGFRHALVVLVQPLLVVLIALLLGLKTLKPKSTKPQNQAPKTSAVRLKLVPAAVTL